MYERNVHRCGFHKSVLDDPENNRFMFEDDDCAMCASIDVKHRVMAEKDAAWSKANPDAEAKVRRPGDGRSLTLRPMTAAEIEKANQAKQTKGVARGGSPGKRQGRR